MKNGFQTRPDTMCCDVTPFSLVNTHDFLGNMTVSMSSPLQNLTLRLLMSYIYIYIYMEHPFLMFLDHTQRRITVGRTPLDE